MGLRLREKSGTVLLYLGSKKLLRFVPLRPEWADIRVTENCNSRCITCNAWKNRSVNELTTGEIKDVIHQLKAVGVNNVVFMGGEPLLRSDIGDLVKEAAAVGFRNIIVVTNGLLLKDKAEELLRNGVTHITVSVDGVGATDDEIRGVSGSFERAIAGVETVQRLKKNMGVSAEVSLMTTILLNQNVEEIAKLVELARGLGAHWAFNLLDSNLDIFRGIPYSDLLVKSGQKIDETIDYLERICEESPELVTSCNHMLEFARTYLKGSKQRGFHCIHGYKAVYIGSHGEVYYGCYSQPPVSSVRKHKLEAIVGSKQHRKVAERMYMKECSGCTNRYDLNIGMKHLLSHQLNCVRKSNKRQSAQRAPSSAASLHKVNI